MGNIWSQSVARRALMGSERTHNPSPAASALLGKRKVGRAKAKLRRLGRRRAYKGNPAGAVTALLGGALGGPPGALLGGLLGGARFRAPSSSRAAKIAPALVTAANAGNLTAAAGLIERAAKPMTAKESAVWKMAAAQLAPAIVAAVHKYATLIPAADQTNPENFAASVMASAVSLPEIQAREMQARGVATSAAERRAAREEAKQATREAQLAGVAGAGLQALARGGRRPTQRRTRRRRSTGRAFSF